MPFWDYCVYSLQIEIVHLTNYGLLLPGPHFQLCTLTIYEKVVFVRHINYLWKVPKTQMWYSTFCIFAKETNTTLNCVPWRVCKYYYCWFDCIAYQECCDRWGPLWLRGPLYPPFPYKLYVINLLKLLQPKNKRVLMTFIRNINVTMIIWNNCRNWSVSVRSATQTSAKKSSPMKKRKKISCGRSTLPPMLATVASMPL